MIERMDVGISRRIWTPDRGVIEGVSCFEEWNMVSLEVNETAGFEERSCHG